MSDVTAQRTLARIIPGVATADGAGVRLTRSLGQNPHARLDPFLMLDEFSSVDPNDYRAGFPAHPHRGFQTVTYMLEGHMLHEDHMGNRGDLVGGGVQWMNAGCGVIHSEMPQQTAGRMHGFQLWINLPAAEKMSPAAYRDIPPEQIPIVELGPGVTARMVAGALTTARGMHAPGPVQGLSTEAVYADLAFDPGRDIDILLNPAHSGALYVYQGELRVAGGARAQVLSPQQCGVLSAGSRLHVAARGTVARALLLTGKPLGEPVEQYGPFVMNTREEIEQAIHDYQSGRLTDPTAA